MHYSTSHVYPPPVLPHVFFRYKQSVVVQSPTEWAQTEGIIDPPPIDPDLEMEMPRKA